MARLSQQSSTYEVQWNTLRYHSYSKACRAKKEYNYSNEDFHFQTTEDFSYNSKNGDLQTTAKTSPSVPVTDIIESLSTEDDWSIDEMSHQDFMFMKRRTPTILTRMSPLKIQVQCSLEP